LARAAELGPDSEKILQMGRSFYLEVFLVFVAHYRLSVSI
jgi:hypothetical protein